MSGSDSSIILETAVEGEKDVQDIHVHGRFEKLVVTLLVMRAFSKFPGALRGCGYFRHPSAVFRVMPRCPSRVSADSSANDTW
jgi:hypothetical protein